LKRYRITIKGPICLIGLLFCNISTIFQYFIYYICLLQIEIELALLKQEKKPPSGPKYSLGVGEDSQSNNQCFKRNNKFIYYIYLKKAK